MNPKLMWGDVRKKIKNVWENLLQTAIEQIFVYKNKVLIAKTCSAVYFFL